MPLHFSDRNRFWAGAHDSLIEHFDAAFKLIAESGRKPESLAYRKAVHLLTFREPRELCLGYTAKGTGGAGGGKGYALGMAAAISDAIKRGLEHPRHFEELGVLNEGIGADRISDITCTILKPYLIRYTQQVAERHGITLHEHSLFASGFDTARQRWSTDPVQLPTNPSTGGPLLLVPHRFLRELPVLNADDWFEFYENEMLREDVNYELMRDVDKKTIIQIAREHPEMVRNWTEASEKREASAYDFARDPKGVWGWDKATSSFTEANPLVIPPPGSFGDFLGITASIIRQYSLFIEDQGGWYLLWDGANKDKPEHAAQLLFRGVAQSYCRANNISIDAEVNLGRGPVDFKFSNGYQKRVHLEVKKMHNGKFWNGLEKQLPSYMKSDEVQDGWFLALRYRSGKAAENRAKELPGRVAVVAKIRNIKLRYSVVDARPKKAASKL